MNIRFIETIPIKHGHYAMKKSTEEELNGRRFLEGVVRHLGWPHDEGVPPVDLTDGYFLLPHRADSKAAQGIT
jgi:hypothetical protein